MDRRFGWHNGTLTCRDINVKNTFTVGDLDFGQSSLDTLIIKGRVSTSTIAGAAIPIAASYVYGEGLELRYQVTNWTGVGSSFKGMYLRSEAATNSAAGKSVFGTEIYGVCNNVTMTTGSLWGTRTYAYVKGTGAVTIENMYAGQFENSWDASRTADCTITTEAAVILAKYTAGRVADYTKLHGMILRFGEMDGDSQKFGKGILIEDDSDMAGTSTLTTGIEMTIGCDKGIDIRTSGGAASASGLLMGTGTSASPATTSVADAKFLEFRCQSTATSGDNRLLYMRYELNGTGGGEALRAFTKVTAAVGTARGAHISLDVSTDGSISGLGVGIDGQLLLPGEAMSGGTWATVNSEIFTVASTTVSGVTRMSMFRGVVSGDATAIEDVDDNAFFLELGGITAGSGNIIDTDITTHTAYGGLKVYIPGVGTRWIALVSA